MKTNSNKFTNTPKKATAQKSIKPTIGAEKIGGEKKLVQFFTPRWLNLVLIGVISLVFWGTYAYIYDSKLDLNGDNMVYYSLGQALHAGKGYSDMITFEGNPHGHFPPGYPFFISLVMNFSDAVTSIKFVNGLLFYFSVLLLFSIFKKISGKVWISFAACLLISFHGEIHRYATIMMSEMLYMFLTVSLIWIILNTEPDKAFHPENRKKTIAKLLVFAICFGYIYLVRTMGTSFILAVLFVLFGQTLIYLVKGLKARKDNPNWWRNGLTSAALLLVLATASFGTYKLAWDARNKSVGFTKSDYVNDFNGKMGGGKMETTSDWTERIQRNFGLYVTGWIPKAVFATDKEVDIAQETPVASSDWLIGLSVLTIILVGAFTLKDKYLLILYMSITFAVLLVWQEQYGGLRYFLTVIPLVLFCFLHGLWKALEFVFKKYKKKEPTQGWLYALCLLVPFLLFSNYSKSVNAQHEIGKYKNWNEAVNIIGPAGAEYITACDWIGKNLPKDAIVACRKPEIFYMYSGYRKAKGILREGKPDQILDYLIKNKVEYIIIDHWYRHAIATIIPLATKYYPYMFKPILAIGGEYKDMPPTYILKFDPTAKAVQQQAVPESAEKQPTN